MYLVEICFPEFFVNFSIPYVMFLNFSRAMPKLTKNFLRWFRLLVLRLQFEKMFFSEVSKCNVTNFEILLLKFRVWKRIHISKTGCNIDFEWFYLIDVSLLGEQDFFYNFWLPNSPGVAVILSGLSMCCIFRLRSPKSVFQNILAVSFGLIFR